MLIDSHTHLANNEFSREIDQIIKRSGLDYILDAALDLDSIEISKGLADKYPNIFMAVGVHPNESEKIGFNSIKPFMDNPKVKAIGEIGLDYYRDHAPKKNQEEVFKQFLAEAEKRSLPVVIHQRNAQEDVLNILKDFSVFGVMHCFSGDVPWAKQCLDVGFYISFAGNITYPKAEILREVAGYVPIESLLIETDCPWLAPQQMRGKRNEPGYVKYVAEEIAKIKGISAEEVGKRTGENFKKLFNI